MNYLAAPGIKNLIHPQIAPPVMQRQTATNIIETVCRFYGLGVDEIKKKDRRLQIIKCKHICIYLITQKVTGLSLNNIADLLGGMDHTTVIHARQKVAGQLSSKFDNEFKTDVKTLLQII